MAILEKGQLEKLQVLPLSIIQKLPFRVDNRHFDVLRTAIGVWHELQKRHSGPPAVRALSEACGSPFISDAEFRQLYDVLSRTRGLA